MGYKIKKYINQWIEAGFPISYADAPNWVISFDKMIIIYSGCDMKSIRRVAIYNSNDDKILGEF